MEIENIFSFPTFENSNMHTYVSPVTIESYSLPIRFEEDLKNLLLPRLHRVLSQILIDRRPLAVSTGLWALIEDSLDTIAEGRGSFEPGLGMFTQSFACDEHYIIQLCLLMVTLGGTGCFKCRVPSPLVAYIGSDKLTLSEEVIITSDAESVSVKTANIGGGNSVTFFDRVGPSLALRTFRDAHWFKDGFSIHVINNMAGWNGDTLLTREFKLSEKDRGELINCLDPVLQFIKIVSPKYYAWLRPILRAVVFIDATEGNSPLQLVSHSEPSRPGMITLSYPMPVDKMAVQLVHECAHQYFYAFSHEHCLIEAGYSKEHTSPFKNFPRPLELVLLAQHAGVNMAVFCRNLILSGFHSGYIKRELDQLLTTLPPVFDEAMDSGGLTDSGQNFINMLKNIFTTRVVNCDSRLEIG